MPCAETKTIWHCPRGEYGLPGDEVHVWRATLDQPAAGIAAFMRVLSADERARAEKFHFEADRKRHVIGRGLSRRLLGHCLGRPADGLQFQCNEFGKPDLAPGPGPPLRFNI